MLPWKDIDNAYCLVRPPGHHATSNCGMGFCLFNNVVLGALHARTLHTQDGSNKRIRRIAIVDYDVHHGNGTQDAFYKDKDCLFISLHQDSNYPEGSGGLVETGADGAEGSNINIPLPPGSGTGAYDLAFRMVRTYTRYMQLRHWLFNCVWHFCYNKCASIHYVFVLH